jgi:hypothetical protein
MSVILVWPLSSLILLVKKAAHLGGYFLCPDVVHSNSMRLFTAEVSPIVNTNADDA